MTRISSTTLRRTRNDQRQSMRIAEFDIDVRVISGREEARLIYLGVKHAIKLEGGANLIVDIGGGSVEFIVADSRQAKLLESRKLGAARMTALFVKSDPIKSDDQAA